MSAKNINCLKCDTSLKDSSLKRYCRACIINIKENKKDKNIDNTCKCTNCKEFKNKDSFIQSKILLTCDTCRIRKNASNNRNNKNIKCKEPTEEDTPEDIIRTHPTTTNNKLKYRNRLQTILLYLKDKYNIIESMEQLENINKEEEEELDTQTTTDLEND